METIGVSEPVKEKLEELKESDDHTSYDSLIRELLLRVEYTTPGKTNYAVGGVDADE